MNYTDIRLEENDGIAVLTMDRPKLLNALSQHSLKEMAHALDRVRDEGTARVLVLTGEGRAFCSGADLTAGESHRPVDMGAGLEAGFNPVLERLRRLPVPLITAVNGLAAGGGCGYALAGDIAIAARSAYFLQPFANIGLVPDVGATWLLPRLIGKARATAMMLLGDRIMAEQAHEWGMIYNVVDDEALTDAVMAMARRLASGPTVAYGLMRQGIADSLEMSLSQSLTLERNNQRTAGRTQDHSEGVSAFLEKRKPNFVGR